MFARTLVILWILGLFLGFVPAANADFDDFIDEGKYESKADTCIKKWEAYTDRCNNPNKKKERKCIEKASSLNATCIDNARKNAINYGDLPPDAKKEYAKISVKHDKVKVKCLKTAKKGLFNCAMRYSSNEGKEKACDDDVTNKYAACLENMFKKHTFKSKKMVRLLQGKTP